MEERIQAALGRIKADLVFKNGTVVDVFCRRLVCGDVAVQSGMIVGIGEYEGIREIDAKGKFILPSFIDSHVHIESSMLTPFEYAKTVIPFGVTCVVADPHEIANVCGERGIKFMMDSAKNSVLDVLYMAPSCIPSTEFEDSGAAIDSNSLELLKNKFNFLGLGEMMNYEGVLNCSSEILKKFSLFERIDGHAPGLSGKRLNGYAACGIGTDHECETAEEAMEKMSRGMFILAREGTAAKNLESMMKAVNPKTVGRIAFCTDDKHAGEIMREGTISNCVNKAVSLGIDPIDAIVMASLSGSMCYGLKSRGSVAPGYCADILLCDTLDAQNIRQVYKNGILIAEDGKYIGICRNKINIESLEGVLNTVNIKSLEKGCFTLEYDSSRPVIEVVPGSIVTKKSYVETKGSMPLCAVIERHRALGKIGLSYIKGISINRGAIAQSIGHDSHNITAIGDSEDDMMLAVEALGKSGGISAVKEGKVLAVMELPAAGLMSLKSASEVIEEKEKLLDAIKSISDDDGSKLLMLLSFISLIVVPELKLNDNGLFDVNQWKYID
jgi:adenine deaminase